MVRGNDDDRMIAAGWSAFPDDELALVYRDLRAIARRYLRHERVEHTLQPTALVHEAWLRLSRSTLPAHPSRGDLVGLAARSMRQVLIHSAERHRALRRGGDRRRVALEPALAAYDARCGDLLALDEALDALERIDRRQAQIVELRFFGGLTVVDVAELIGAAPRTVEREWAAARSWLREALDA